MRHFSQGSSAAHRCHGVLAQLARAVAALVIAAIAIAPAHAARIPWNDSISYSRTSVDEDVKDVLRGALRANGLSVVFQGTVEGKVNGNFEDMTPREVFDRLTSQFGLSYEFDGTAKIVTIYSEDSADARNAGRSFVALSNISFTELQSVLDFLRCRLTSAYQSHIVWNSFTFLCQLPSPKQM